MLRADLISNNDDYAKRLADAGGVGCSFGVESGNEDLRQLSLQKRLTDFQIIDAANDITNLIGLTMREKDPDKKISERKNLSEKILPKWLGFLEDLLDENKLSEWFAGKNMSIADLCIWRLLGWVTSGKLDHVPTTILESFPNLTKLYNLIDNHPKVCEWMLLKYKK